LIANPPVCNVLNGMLSVVADWPPATDVSPNSGFGLSFEQVP